MIQEPASGKKVVSVYNNMKRGQTLHICDRAYIIDDGKNLRDGDPKTIINDELVRKHYLASTFKGDEFD